LQNRYPLECRSLQFCNSIFTHRDVHFDQEGLRLSFLILMKNAVLWIFIPSRQEGDSSFQLFFLKMDEIISKKWGKP